MTNLIKILFIGDVMAKSGRLLVRELIPELINRHQIDLVVANGENASGGIGINIKAAEELFDSGVQVMTSGNHIFKHKEILDYLDNNPRLLRPMNYPEPAPGSGITVVETSAGIKVGVANLLGRVFMDPIDCPFRTADKAVTLMEEMGASVTLFDFHAEATSEKQALGRYLDGRAGAVLGTHTHVQTADDVILPEGTAYISDVGMTGPHDSVIGMQIESVLKRFLYNRPVRFKAGKRGPVLEAVVVSIDEKENKAENIIRIKARMESPR